MNIPENSWDSLGIYYSSVQKNLSLVISKLKLIGNGTIIARGKAKSSTSTVFSDWKKSKLDIHRFSFQLTVFLLLNSKADNLSSLHGPYIVCCCAVVLILMMRSDLGSVGTTSSLHSTAHTAFAFEVELNTKFKFFFPFVSIIGFELLQYLELNSKNLN